MTVMVIHPDERGHWHTVDLSGVGYPRPEDDLGVAWPDLYLGTKDWERVE